jgi:endo-alpha-1,4-polygalactosaminidase (GH114 family)
VALVTSCTSAPDDGGQDLDDTAKSPEVGSDEVPRSPRRARAWRAEDHMIHYGGWDPSTIAIAQTHDVVVLDPNEPDLTRAQVAAIQGGTDPTDPAQRVLVVCYLSIGEDQRTAGLTDEEMANDPRFVGDGTGPRIDPRGPYADGESLAGIAPLGLPSNGGTGYASYYLDDNSVRNGDGNVGDGIPDRNGNFGGCFVNAGDPAWFDTLQDMTYDGPDELSGLREILTTTYGRGLGCDGVFLDTIDTAAPNAWTDAGSANETKFEWTAPGFSAFLQRLRASYPDVVIVQNRGLFFFNPANEHYAFIPRGNLDFVVYESYRLNSSSSDNPHPYHYPNNRFNFAPKLMAEANRADGFRVLSLGYAEGPADQMSEATLRGESTLGYESLLEDIRVAERLAGFRHYLSNSSVNLVNRFVVDHADRADAEPPVWTSTWNDRPGYPAIPTEPTPRVGIQEVVAGPSTLTVRWDVALDLGRVGYVLYYQTTPFDFAADPLLCTATRLPLTPQPTTRYGDGVGPGSYPNEATLTNLVAGQTYYLLIRALDDSPAANEEQNQVVLTGTPLGTAPYLGRRRASNGVESLTYRVQHTDTWSWRRVYVDRDRVTGTGLMKYGIGADFLIENGSLYRYSGTGASWAWTYVKPVASTTGSIDGMTFVRWDLAQADLGAGGRHTSLVFQVQRPGAVNTGPVLEHVYTTSDPASPYLGYYVENDATKVYFHAEIGPAFTWKHVFIDDDANPATGYAFGGVGAGYMIENGNLYAHVGPGWTWHKVASANLVVNGASHDWWIRRGDVGATAGSPRFDVVYQANGGATTFVAPKYAYAFGP